MEQKIMDCFANPTKCKLILEIHSAGKVTAKELSEKFKDIPTATLYRYLKRMTNDQILRIVDETPIRGTVERTYSVALELNGDGEISAHNSGSAYMQIFMQYIFSFIKQFGDYCQRDDINIVEDRSGFAFAPICATDEELTTALTEYSKIIEKLRNQQPSKDRKLRTIGLIIAPPEKYKD